MLLYLLNYFFHQVCHKITEDEYSIEFLSGQKPQPKAFKQVKIKIKINMFYIIFVLFSVKKYVYVQINVASLAKRQFKHF